MGYFVSTFCLCNVQNMSKKNRGKNLFPKSLPRILLIISILSFIPLQQPVRLLIDADYQIDKSLL